MIKATFNQSKTLFIPFIMAGHPTLDDSFKAILALRDSKADIIELGVPFSDPVADGPVNQHAAELALAQGITLKDILSMIKKLRTEGCQTPILLFSYFNPILAFGCEHFATEAIKSGVNGVLIVDLPPEEGLEFYTMLKQQGLEIALLTSPTTDPSRFHLYQDLNPSFIYYISRQGVTGAQKTLSDALETEVCALRKHLPNIKIAVGFGISCTEQASEVTQYADGVIVGSILVDTLEQHGLASLGQLALTFREAIG